MADCYSQLKVKVEINVSNLFFQNSYFPFCICFISHHIFLLTLLSVLFEHERRENETW